MPLNKKQRDAMPGSDFAVPKTRDLPIHDRNHVSMAWKMVDNTKGLSTDQRDEAKKRILNRAKKLGMDTSDWKGIEAAPDANDPYPDKGDLKEDNKSNEEIEHEMEEEQEEHEQRQDEANLHSVSFSALAMEIPDQTKDHPNQVPFKGILTRIDEPSDNPLSGSNGKRVILPKSVAEKSLSSLLGMAIDCTDNLDGHDSKYKIGIITSANIVGNEIAIEGFFYGADFPSEIKRIQAEKSLLGFSYEVQAQIRSMNDDPLVIKDCVFTGAAVLYKDKAAYTTTSLSAKMEKSKMSQEILKALEELNSKISALESKVESSSKEMKMAAGSVQNMVKPHSDAIRACASAMMNAGMGMHAKAGHVAVLNGMADSMDADAALGKMPHVYQTSDFYSASAVKVETSKESAELNSLKFSISELSTQIADLKGAKFDAAAEPQRKTIEPSIMHLLARKGINLPEGDDKISVSKLDEMLKDANTDVKTRLQIKHSLESAGKLKHNSAQH